METEPERAPAAGRKSSACTISTNAARPILRGSTPSPPSPTLRAFLESLVSRAYTEIHETRARPEDPLEGRCCWPSRALSAATWAPFACRSASLCWAAPSAGSPSAWTRASKAVLMPFPRLLDSPAERVQKEESAKTDRLQRRQGHASRPS